MLRYTNESVSKYWHDENYRFFTLKMNADGNLYIISSNKTNCKIYGFPYECTGKSLYDLMGKERADRWHERFAEWKEKGLTSYIAHFAETSILWNTTVEVIGDTVFGIGVKVKSSESLGVPMGKLELFNHYLIKQRNYIIIQILAEPSINSFVLTSIYSNSKLNISNFVGKDIRSLTCHCSNILDNSAFKSCILNKCIVEFADKLNIDNELFYFNFSLLPLVSESKIIMYGEEIDEVKYNSILTNSRDNGNVYPDSNQFAACELSYTRGAEPFIIGYNNFFNTILRETNISILAITDNPAFQNCVKSLASETSNITLKVARGASLNYKINITYMPISNTYMAVLFPNAEPIAGISLDSTSLTKRQKEVLSYVASGLTNRYIATKLNISEGTVKKTIYNGYKKLGICSRVELVKLLASNYVNEAK